MANILEQILGLTQPSAPPPASAPRRFSAAEERAARANGFRSAEEMVLFEQQRSRKREPQTVAGQSRPSVEAAMSWHPKNIFEKILAAWPRSGED